jgi:catechol 2,3-dioxygenase-like lactoylglutathione lyase family enzyme
MFDCIGIAVEDPKKSIHFYSILDLKFKSFSDKHFEATTLSGVRIMLDTYEFLKELNPNWKKCEKPSTVIGFKVNSHEQVDLLISKFRKQSSTIIKEPFDAPWGQRYASVLDPDGNQIDIFSNE